MSQTTTRRANVQPRTLNLGAPDHRGHRLLTLTVGQLATRYVLWEIASEIGGRAFRLDKYGADEGADAGEMSYDVRLDGAETSCTCKGHVYGDRCKHTDALAALVQLGKL